MNIFLNQYSGFYFEFNLEFSQKLALFSSVYTANVAIVQGLQIVAAQEGQTKLSVKTEEEGWISSFVSYDAVVKHEFNIGVQMNQTREELVKDNCIFSYLKFHTT